MMNDWAKTLHDDRLEGQSLDLAEIVDFFLRRWKWIIGAMLLVLAITVGAVHSVTPTYSGSAQILLESTREKVLGGEAVIADLVLNSSIMESQLAILKSDTVLRRVVERQGLANDPEFNGSERGISLPGFAQALGYLSRLGIGSSEEYDGAFRDPVAAAVEALEQAVEVSRIGQSNVIRVTVYAATPVRAAALANAMAEAYVEDQLEARYKRTKRASGWLNDREAALQDELRKSEAVVEEFRTRHNLVSTPAGTITEQQLSELSTALIKARAETAAKRASVAQLQKLLADGGDIQTLPELLSIGLLPELRARLAAITQMQADLASRYGERHPDLIKSRAERGAVEAQIAAEIKRVIANLRNELEVAESREASLASSLSSVSGQSGAENQVAVQLRELERVAAADKQVYEAFLARARIAEEETMLPMAEARIISPATVPNVPSSPHKKLFAALAVILGLGIGTGTAVLLELFSPGFVARRQVEEILDLPVLASLPRVEQWRASARYLEPGLVEELNDMPFSHYTEAIRSLRFGIDAISSSSESASRVIQVTSALPEEGKTTLAVSLALSAAAAGERVLFIDADLRLRAASGLFNLQGRLGLVDMLTASADVRDAVHLDERSGLYVLAAGATTRNPPALLGSARMQSLISHAKDAFDRIIIDSPPVAPAADAAVLSRSADRILFAVKWNNTPREAVAQAITQLRSRDRIAGIVLTMVDEDKLPRFGRYLSLSSNRLERYEVN
jgi:exopolysaccharide transport family protein